MAGPASSRGIAGFRNGRKKQTKQVSLLFDSEVWLESAWAREAAVVGKRKEGKE